MQAYVAPNALELNTEDSDISSAGVLMLPFTVTPEPGVTKTELRPLASGKDGIFRVVQPTFMTLAQSFQATFNERNLALYPSELRARGPRD